jgi:hypothetical protein
MTLASDESGQGCVTILPKCQNAIMYLAYVMFFAHSLIHRHIYLYTRRFLKLGGQTYAIVSDHFLRLNQIQFIVFERYKSATG